MIVKIKLNYHFDFAILNDDKSVKFLIEYDGIQHFEPRDAFGGEEAFNYTLRKDKIKDDYCKNNNIKLIRIPYWELKRIEQILLEKLGE